MMQKLMEINDELVRVREERDRLREERDQAVGNVVRLQAELAATHEALQRVCSTLSPKSAGQSDLVRDVSHYIEAAEVDRPTEPQQHPAEYTPPDGWRVLQVGERLRDGDMIVRKDGSRYPAERLGGWVGSNQRHIRLIEPQPEQDGVLVQEGWWLQADGNRVYVRPTNPTASNKGKIAQGYVWSDGVRLYHSDGGHGDTPTPHDLVKFLGKHVKTQPAEPQQHPAEYTPPEGWRVLRPGELLQPGDQWVNWEGTESRPDILHGDGATVSGGRYIRQIEPEPEFKPYTFAAYIVGDKSQPDALRIVWATEEWIQHSQFGIVHRMRDMHLFDNDGGCNITEYHETLTLSLKIQ